LSNSFPSPYHVERGKLFIAERFNGHKIIDAERITSYIALTKFPVPDNEDNDTKSLAALVRAADLLGQLSDARYLQKIAALYYEFVETGAAGKLGYKCPEDLRRGYPKFYWGMVYKHVKHALGYLQFTQEGKSYVAQLYANVFAVEHGMQMEEALTTPTKKSHKAMPFSTPITLSDPVPQMSFQTVNTPSSATSTPSKPVQQPQLTSTEEVKKDVTTVPSPVPSPAPSPAHAATVQEQQAQ